MPRLDDHGLGGGGKSIGVPIYPFNMSEVFVKNDEGSLLVKYGDAITTIPENQYSGGGCAGGGAGAGYMFLIGMMDNTRSCYKYNVTTKQWTKLTDALIGGVRWAVRYLSSIYYGGSNGVSTVYRYNISSNTHSATVDSGRYMEYSRATIDGDSIYIFGGNRNSSYQTKATSVNLATSTAKSLTEIPSGMYNHVVVNGGNGYIYLFGGQVNGTKAYKYSISSNTYTAISDMPFSCYGGMGVRIDNYIYLINSAHSLYTKSIYAYDILTNTYTSLGNTPKARQYGVADVVNGDVYMIGGGTSATTYLSGESARIGKFKTLNLLHQRLTNGCKVYTDGDINTGTVTNKVFEQATTVEKVNGVATIPADNEYFLVGANYATIGG